ncbi:MAG TPA: hypothetical protein VGU20_13780 [Stellaceae bacterium]|nr:hypothetical protein [Stellaceae bacterium]
MASLHKMAVRVISAALIGGAGVAAAADFPKEGKYDITSCWSGIGNNIDFSKTHSAMSYELTGTTRSNPPGGFLDMTAFRCVGFTGTIDGKVSGMNMCEGIDKDGDKYLIRSIVEPPKNTLEGLAGTGKYEGIVRTGVAESLGAFPAAKPGTFEGCNHGTGAYKMK